MGQIPASFPRLVADAFFAHPVETISRPFSAAFGPRVSKSTFGGTGVSDCSVPGNHLSVLTSPSEAAILQGNNGVCVAEQACALRRCIVWRGAQSLGAGDGIVRGWTFGLREPQRGSLIPPIEGQSGVGHQLVGGEPRRLLPCKDRGDNIRSEKSQPHKARPIRSRDPFLVRDGLERRTVRLEHSLGDFLTTH